MKSLFIGLSKLGLMAVLLASAVAVSAQDARLRFEKLNGLETRARDVVEVNIEGKLLDMARRVLSKTKNADGQKVSQAIKDLQGIYVRVYNFENENEYNPNDVDEVRSQLNSPGWERLANVRSKKNNQKVDVYTMFSGDVMSGLAVIVTEAKSIAVVNVVGPIDIDLLTELGGKLNIPELDIEKDKN
jgi:hypothetical protein